MIGKRSLPARSGAVHVRCGRRGCRRRRSSSGAGTSKTDLSTLKDSGARSPQKWPQGPCLSGVSRPSMRRTGRPREMSHFMPSRTSRPRSKPSLGEFTKWNLIKTRCFAKTAAAKMACVAGRDCPLPKLNVSVDSTSFTCFMSHRVVSLALYRAHHGAPATEVAHAASMKPRPSWTAE